ncbi:MAG TPA: hypothetical protein VFV50_17940 [Bdellovibrionales bacterium]|nr:hypothetical protein [Bdellovibrionales bacterium]
MKKAIFVLALVGIFAVGGVSKADDGEYCYATTEKANGCQRYECRSDYSYDVTRNGYHCDDWRAGWRCNGDTQWSCDAVRSGECSDVYGGRVCTDEEEYGFAL